MWKIIFINWNKIKYKYYIKNVNLNEKCLGNQIKQNMFVEISVCSK